MIHAHCVELILENQVTQPNRKIQHLVYIEGNYYEDEYNMVSSIICDYVNSEHSDPYYKWKDNSYGTSHTTIRKGNMYINFKIDMYSIDGSSDYSLKIKINRQRIIKYIKKKDNYNSNHRKKPYFCK